METTLKFDRVILVKELNEKFKNVGEVFEIANISDNSFLLRDGRTRVAVGVISFNDFEEHFVHENNFCGWTPWTSLVGFNGQNDAFYRTNRKKVQVRCLIDKVRAESCCHKDDDFNLFFGIQAAYLRCMNKALEKQKTECEEKIKVVDSEIAENESILKRMINSLNR